MNLIQFIAILSSNQLNAGFVESVANEIQAVAVEEKPIFSAACSSCVSEADKDAYNKKASACLAATWFYKESVFNPKAVGDMGTSFGVGQMKAVHAAITGISLEIIKTDRKESIRAGWRLLRHEVLRCGDVVRGLGAYASGKCGGAPDKVKTRLRLTMQCLSMPETKI